jgi:hypothetical protein
VKTGRAYGYTEYVGGKTPPEEEPDITQMSEEDKKKLAIKRRLQKTRKVKP